MELTDDRLNAITWDGKSDMSGVLDQLREMALNAESEEEVRAVTRRIATLSRQFRIKTGIGLAATPLEQAIELDPGYKALPHLELISNALAEAVRKVERGQNQKLAVSMPPRSGKSELISKRSPLWMLRRHPEWKIVMSSYSGGLVGDFAKWIRTTIEDNPQLGIALARDGGKASIWSTVEGGGLYTTSTRGGLTGRGARVVFIDDPIKDFIEAHSPVMRQNVWDWWLSVVQTRLEPPYLIVVVQTRWHEDDFIGRLLSPDHEGDPRDWNLITLPAIAEENDIIGRAPGDPLRIPVIDESRAEALDRWDDVKRAVGGYTWSALYQQRPAPARGAIFDTGWWRYWTSNPERATEDGRIVFLDPHDLHGGQWVDSWDTSFKGSTSSSGTSSDFVVGQRWVRMSANRYLIAQLRDRWSFTQTIDKMLQWGRQDDDYASPYGRYVHDRLIEDRANGSAIIDTLRDRISGLKPINPTTDKASRARAVTPEVESGNVFLPHPADEGNEWVQDLLSELRNFPHDAADDQVDALTQALSYLRYSGGGAITVPGGGRPTPRNGVPGWQQPRDLARDSLRSMAQTRGRR
jgi:predicted phage terminase large subunit-like protein